MIVRLIIALLLSVSVFAQEPIEINDFSGGLNTKDGIFHVRPNQCIKGQNWDLSDETFALKIRNGYVPIGYKPDTNSLKFLYTHYYRDGRKELFGIAKSDTLLCGKLYRSGDSRYVLDTSIYDFVYPNADWKAVSWKNNVIFTNGKQRPLIWNGSDCRLLSLPAPGELEIIPVDSTDNLTGEYIYTVFLYDSAATGVCAYISPKVYVNSGGFLLRGFSSIAPDTSYHDTSAALTADTVRFRIFRTKRIHNTRDLYGPDSITFYSLDADDNIYLKNIAVLDTLTILDTFTNGNLGVSAYHPFNVGRLGLDGDTVTARTFGMPNFIERDSSSDEKIGKVQPSGWYLPDSSIIVGVAYMVTFFDSLNQIESDSGRVFYITPEDDDTARYYRIGIPPVPHSDTLLYRRIYKSLLIENKDYSIDTTFERYYYTDYGNAARGINSKLLSEDEKEALGFYWAYRRHFEYKNLDSNFVNWAFYPLVTITSKDSTAYTDSVLWDSLVQRPSFIKSIAPSRLDNITLMDDALWGTEGSKLYKTLLDGVAYWGSWNWYAFNLDDGDEITSVFSDRGNITVMKNNSQHLAYRDNDGEYTLKWIVRGRGCVAPLSVQFYDGGVVYLAENGVFYETAAPAKDRGSERDALSYPIADLLDYSISEKREARSALYKNMYFLSFPDKDTTYVCFLNYLPQKVWMIYDMTFERAINYDTKDNAGLVPSSDMLFITGSDSAIYKFDTTHADKGVDIVARWKSGPIARGSRNIQIDKFGIWTSTPDSVFTFKVYDHRDSGAVESIELTPDDNYYEMGLSPNEGNYFYIEIDNFDDRPAGGVYTDQLIINGIDIYVKPGTAEITH